MEGLTPNKVAVAQWWWWWWVWHSGGLARRNWGLRVWDGGALTRWLGCYLQGKTGKGEVSENVHSSLWKAALWNLLRSRIFSFVDKGGNLQF